MKAPGSVLVVGLLLASVLPVLGQERVQIDRTRIERVPKAELQRTRLKAASKFDRLRQQAVAARAPGGAIAAESSAMLRKLEGKYAPRVEIENARLPGLRPESVSPAGDPDAPVSADPDDMDFERHPCGRPEAPLEVTGIQATPPLDPGELVLVQGCGLGTDPGKLRLMGDFPGGYLELDIEHWYFTQVRGRVPPVAGVGDMPEARVQLVRQDNQLSQLLDVGGFRATREVKQIHSSDVIITCGSGYGNQECEFAQAYPILESEFFGGATFAAVHGDYVTPACDSAVQKLGINEEGADVASVSLANGWELAGLAWWWVPFEGTGYVLPPSGFNVNASSASVTMQWGTNVNQCLGPQSSHIRYRVDLYAVGPKGVPYK